MKKLLSGFTLVELIVSITIVAILATVGFVSYSGYLITARDSNRITQLTDIREGLTLYKVNSLLPLPEKSISLSASGSIYAYQGNLSEQIMDSIGYEGGGFDPKYSKYPIYTLSANRKDFQLLTFLEDAQVASATAISYANIDDYTLYSRYSVGKKLGVLFQEVTAIPLHEISSVQTAGGYDIVNGTENVEAYIGENEVVKSTEGSLLSLLPNQSCKRILEMGNSNGSNIYTINPTGEETVRVYCDMETGGGGWTIVVNNDNRDDEYISDSNINTCYPVLSGDQNSACGSISSSSDFVVNASGIDFTDLLFAIYEQDFQNIKTYRLLEWNNSQQIPNTSTFILGPADNDLGTLNEVSNQNLISCGSSIVDAKYISTQSSNNGWPHNPVTTLGGTSANSGKIGFTDANASNGTDHDSYGFDDFQDGLSCGDSYIGKEFKGYSSYIMIR